ncbi:MAG: amidohydrolase family protein [Clostridia bacterium]|nr:amidohydrolase family protein [Clostridia bacterium]
MKNYKIIDAHCHIYPDKIAQKASDSTGNFYQIPSLLDGKISTLLEHGKKAGIEHFIVQSVATTPKQVSSINNFIAQSVADSNGKFTGLGTLHPDSEDIEADFNEIIELGLKGVKLHPDIQKFKIDDYRMLKIYELCEGKLPILIHTGDNRYDYSNPNRMIPILDIYKDLTVIGAHFGGWSIWEEATEKFKNYKNFYVDCSSSFYALTFEKARELIMAYGTKKVLFGTDYPMWEPETELIKFMQIDLTEQERQDILYNNAAKLFNIK